MFDSALLPLTGSRTSLRPLAVRDAAIYVEGTRDPSVRAYAHLPEPNYTVELVTRLANTVVPEGLRRADLAMLSIVDTTTDGFLGSLVIFDVTAESAEVGFWLHPDARGSGRSTDALELASEFASRSGLVAITARTATDNLASQKTLTRAGFEVLTTAPGLAPSGREVELVHYERQLREGREP
ncbi:GNAT family N-acetyltransferase [Mycolicibacterium nivoides]|uniref:GNAT family N-acetyltransferase n=1 Tax=Mycolicibacterium nivoides TaxID=2487344 RepID=UPI003C2AF6D6